MEKGLNILLLGEYSSLFKNLKEGLEHHGHKVTLAAWRDGYKRIPVDIDLDSQLPWGLSKIARRLNPFLKISLFQGFDVVQLINPYAFYKSPLVNKIFYSYVIKKNKSFFLSGAGDDAYFWHYARRTLKYGPFDDFLRFDVKEKSFHMQRVESLKYNKWLINKSSGYIPIMYEYEVGYRECSKRLTTIPIPINLKKIKYSENKVDKKLIVFHGLNRFGFKGTRHVEKAFDYLKKKYPNELTLLIKGHMPLKDYLELMEQTNVVVDQVYSHSLGMNGVYALAMGKVVMGGAEKESLESLKIEKSPVINIKPDWRHIVFEIEKILENRNSICAVGRESRMFCERVHDCVGVAERYIEVWRANSKEI